MVKVAYVVSTLKRSGPTNQLYNLLRYLDLYQFKPYVITLSNEPLESRWADFEKLGVELYSLRLSRINGFIRGSRKLGFLIDKLRPDIIQSQGIRSDMLVSQIRSMNPKISTLRNYPQRDYPMTYGILGRLMARQHIKYLKTFTCCVGVSISVCCNAEEQFGFSKMIPIHNGVDTEVFSNVRRKDKIKLRKKIGLPINSQIWVSTGHLTQRKKPLLLIELWEKHFKKNTKYHLLFIGDGSLMKACKHASIEFENIHFAGRVADVTEYLQAADFFVSASTAEGLPNSVLEAMACGLPFLLSDIPPHREVWEFNKGAGRLFEVDNEESFLNAYSGLVSEDYEMLSGNAIKAINDRFNAKKMSKRYQELYRQVLSDKENKC